MYQTDIWGEMLRPVRLQRWRFRRLGFFLSGLSKSLAKRAGFFKKARRYLDARAFTGQQLMLRRVYTKRYLPFKVRSFNRFLRKHLRLRRYGSRGQQANHDLLSSSALALALEKRIGSILIRAGAYQSAAHMRQAFAYKSGEARFLGHLNKQIPLKGFVKLAPSVLDGAGLKAFRARKLSNRLVHHKVRPILRLKATAKSVPLRRFKFVRRKAAKVRLRGNLWLRGAVSRYSTTTGLLKFPDTSVCLVGDLRSLSAVKTGLPPLVRLKHR